MILPDVWTRLGLRGMDEKSIMERAAAGELKLEPLRKVLCSCQILDPQTGKAKAPCVCKRAKAGRLK